MNNSSPVLRVNLDHLIHNVDMLKKHAGIIPEQVIAVVKDNGYGAGSLAMTRVLLEHGVKYFAVATLNEALFLRNSGIDSEILLLGYTPQESYPTLAAHNITVTVVDKSQLTSLVNSAIKPKLHLLIDTGMRRNGLRYDELMAGEFDSGLVELAATIEGVYTHYYASDQEEQQPTEEQHRQFLKSVEHLTSIGVNPPVQHCSNSGAVLYGKKYSSEMIRPGILLHGISPDCRDSGFELKEVTELHSFVTSVRNACKGEGVSYSHHYILADNSRIATIPLGYGAGFNRLFTGKCNVLIRGKRYPVLPRVTMDYILVDIGSDPVELGDRVTVIGRDGDEFISIADLSSAVDTIPYEVLCQLGSSLPHEYYRHGECISAVESNIF